MKFQILDKNNQPISLGELDAQAAELWGKQVDSKHYATPFDDKKESNAMCTSWYQIIGLTIASQEGIYYAIDTWDNVVYELFHNLIYNRVVSKNDCGNFEFNFTFTENGDELHLNDTFKESMYSMKCNYEKYLELINYWQSKGYKPHKL